jgi:hypothetical protein
MKEFNTNEYYDVIDIFKKAVMTKIENTTVEFEDFYEDALFLVKDDGYGEILNADTMSKELQVSLYNIVSLTIPTKIKQSKTRFYATVNTVNDTEGGMHLLLTVGDRDETSCYMSPVYTDGNYLELGAWESVDPTDDDYAMFTVPVRRAVVNQG